MAVTAEQLEQEYQGVRSGRESLSNMRDTLSGTLGINDKRSVIDNLNRTIADANKLLQRAPENVASDTRRIGGPVTESQQNRLISARQTPLLENLNNASNAMGVEQDVLGMLEDQLREALGLERERRSDEDSDFVRRINSLREGEREARRMQFEKEMAELNASFAERQAALRNSSIDMGPLLAVLEQQKQKIGNLSGSLLKRPVSSLTSGATTAINKKTLPTNSKLAQTIATNLIRNLPKF